MINHLVVNGCSYMHAYSAGQGHRDLAQRLGIPHSESIAVVGSANSRILRTTLKHSFTAPPTLYVLGMTFVSRWELPIADGQSDFEGRWCNPQNKPVWHRWQPGWQAADTELMIEIKLKSEVWSIVDRMEDLMYRILATITSLHSRGHRVLLFQTADDLHLPFMDEPRLSLFDQPEIVEGYRWRSVAWQHQQAVPPTQYDGTMPYIAPIGSQVVPSEMQHRAPGQHAVLNQYLTNYIQQHKILQ